MAPAHLDQARNHQSQREQPKKVAYQMTNVRKRRANQETSPLGHSVHENGLGYDLEFSSGFGRDAIGRVDLMFVIGRLFPATDAIKACEKGSHGLCPFSRNENAEREGGWCYYK